MRTGAPLQAHQSGRTRTATMQCVWRTADPRGFILHRRIVPPVAGSAGLGVRPRHGSPRLVPGARIGRLPDHGFAGSRIRARLDGRLACILHFARPAEPGRPVLRALRAGWAHPTRCRAGWRWVSVLALRIGCAVPDHRVGLSDEQALLSAFILAFAWPQWSRFRPSLDPAARKALARIRTCSRPLSFAGVEAILPASARFPSP